MKIFVGSTNPVKINAVKIAAQFWQDSKSDLEVTGYDVASGVSAQPMTDTETKKGSINRAKKALEAGLSEFATNKKQSLDDDEALGVGLEGGVFEDENGTMWTTVWVSVVDQLGFVVSSNGSRFPVPEIIAEQISVGGEMGPVVDDIVGDSNIKHKQGMIGVITLGFVDRMEEYASIAKMSLGLWHGRDWQDKLVK